MTDHQPLIDRLEALVDHSKLPDWEEVVRRARKPGRAARPAHARRLRRSYLVRRVVPVLLLAVAALVIALIAPWGRGSSFTEGAVAERALVAIGNGSVLHVVLRAPNGSSTYIDLATGQETPQLVTTEVWYDRERRFVHRQDSINGQVFGESLAKPFGTSKPRGWLEGAPYVPYLEDPGLAEFFDGYRSALKTGAAHVTGTGTVDGHNVTWIKLKWTNNGYRYSERVAVDRSSSLPFRIEWVYKGKVTRNYGVVSIETLPAGRGDFTRLKNYGLAPDLRRDHLRSISASDAARALSGALWVGKRISTLQLSKVSRATLTSQNLFNGSKPMVGPGIELHYGDGTPGLFFPPSGRYVWLNETALSASVYWGHLESISPGPPAGSMLTDCGRRGRCDGYMVRDGVHVIINASSRDLLLAAARGLKPIQVPTGTG